MNGTDTIRRIIMIVPIVYKNPRVMDDAYFEMVKEKYSKLD